LLDSYRRSFTEAYDAVVDKIRIHLRLEPTVRPAKSTTSIVEKLRRENVRLSQMQDIAGCRIVVKDIPSQDEVVARLKESFQRLTVVDRRVRPSHGYRAVHAIIHWAGKSIEIQVRTSLQHRWAELSEKLSDLVDPEIKYGGGAPEVLDSLSVAAEEIVEVETAELALLVAQQRGILEDMGRDILKAQQLIAARRKRVVKLIESMGEIVPED
jgi:putative GTP pyrophosphokinase